ncbi:MAG: murein L,D-transpeptidase family protein [Thermodesulfobacteriota bacterium]
MIQIVSRIFISIVALCLLGVTTAYCDEVFIPESEISTEVYQRVGPRLLRAMKARGLELGSPIYIRIFKKEGFLEVWVEKGLTYKLFKSYPVCSFSGVLGPKVKEGDYQSPEGFYSVGAEQLNPWSNYHLSFNLGFPNDYDRIFERTGSALMVHGSCSSMGCYAMTDVRMEEIYTLASMAIQSGQKSFPVHIFPFRMTWQNLSRHSRSRWMSFWENLKQGYDYFEGFRAPPVVAVIGNHYRFFTEPKRLFGGMYKNHRMAGGTISQPPPLGAIQLSRMETVDDQTQQQRQ